MPSIQPFHQSLLEIPKLNQTITLGDGTTLGYAEYGESAGQPVLYFHGGNGSRLEGLWLDEAAKRAGIRLLAPDRPGFGLSDFKPGLRIVDWNATVLEFTDRLGIDRFGVFGLSGGGPFVATLAHSNPEHITRAAMISSVAPPNAVGRFAGMWFPVRVIFFLARRLPLLNRMALQQMGKFYANPQQMRTTMMKGMPKPDVEYFERMPEAIDIFSADASESHRNGIDGDAHEWQLYVHDWGFRIEDISIEVGLWFGRYDVQVPLAMGQYYASALKRNIYHPVEDGGHFSTINNHSGAIFEYLKM